MVAPLLFVLGVFGAGLFIAGSTGCASQVKPPRDPEPPPKKPPDPALDFPQNDHSNVYWLFKMLKENGHVPRDMDRGAFRAAYSSAYCQNKGASCVEGAADNKLSATEVFDFAFQANENYDSSIERILGRAVPWALNDFNKDTSDDERVRTKIKEAIAKLDELLQKQNLAKGSPEYQERLAVGLFYLVATPPAEIVRKRRTGFEKHTEELDQLNLTEFKEFLFERGGLRLMSTDFGVELSALEALRQGKGKSTEHAKLLYAVFKMAGLPAHFAYVNPQKSKDPILQTQAEGNPNVHHFCVALKQGESVRLFDPVVASSQPDHPEYRLLSPRNFVAFECLSRALLAGEKGDVQAFTSALNLSREMDPDSPFLALHEGLVYFYQDKPAEALASFSKALEIYPQYTQALYQRGTLKLAQKDLTGAEQDFSSLIQAAPHYPLSYVNRGQVRSLQKNEKGSIEDFDELIRLRPDTGHLKRGVLFAQMNEAKKAMADFDKALEINPQLAEAYGARGTLWGLMGDLTKSSADFLKLFQMAPGEGSMQAALQGIAPVFIKKWSDRKHQDTFKKIGKEIGLDSVKAETWFQVSGLMWEAGQKQAAAQALKNFADEVQKMKTAASGKDMPLTKNLFRQMRQALPQAMQRDPKIQEILKAFG